MGEPGYFWYTGDYQRDTRHLSLMQDGAYRRLLDHYYSSGKALPADHGALCRIAGAHNESERAAVREVCEEFFPTKDDGLRHNTRADAELAKRRAYLQAQSERSKAGVAARVEAAAKAAERKAKRSTGGSTTGSTKGCTFPFPFPGPFPGPDLLPNGKRARAPRVCMTDGEHEALVKKHGARAVEWMIDALDAYKESKNVTYDSDAGAIRSWVVKKWAEEAAANPALTQERTEPQACKKCGKPLLSGVCAPCGINYERPRIAH